MIDLIIKNAVYPDFKTNQMLYGSIGINDGKIIGLYKTGVAEDEIQAKRIIDACDNIVSPGFIDIHMHEENFNEDGEKYIIAELMLKQGVTTACGGNCGIQNQKLEDFKKTIDRLGGSPINYLMMAGYNQCRYRLGIGPKDILDSEQKKQIHTMLEVELSEGACGISFGIEYDPAISYDEILDALELLKKDKRYLASAHFRESDNGAISSIKEMIALCHESGVKFQISHLDSCAATGFMDDALKIINQEMKSSNLLSYDTYPYNAFSTTIGSSVFEKESLNQWCKDIGSIMLTEEPYLNMFCTEELLQKARKFFPEMLAVGFIMDEGEVKKAITNPYGMIASDGILCHGKGHPRASGTFPRVLRKYVREEEAISLIDALRKMTLLPAERLCLKEKGRIEEGCDADFVIIDPTIISDGATYDNIYAESEGINYVIIDGEIAIDHKKMLNSRLGSFISFR